MFLRANHVEQMVKDGWCPLDAEKCRKAGGEVDTPAYLLQLVRTKPAWNKRNHELCNKTECVADNVDESLYVTRHVQEDCGCEHVHADIQTLHEILESGGIPLVEITPPEEDSEHYAVKVVKKRTSKRYVSVSHVWADGLGNPHSNSLPNCQLGLLYERARMLLTDKEYTPQYQNGPFGALHTGAARFAHRAFNSAKRGDNSVLVWIDTLCIPHAREVRSLAIQRIRDVYVGGKLSRISQHLVVKYAANIFLHYSVSDYASRFRDTAGRLAVRKQSRALPSGPVLLRLDPPIMDTARGPGRDKQAIRHSL